MWSQSCEVLNPYEAIMADLHHKEMLKEKQEAERCSVVKNFFKNLFRK